MPIAFVLTGGMVSCNRPTGSSPLVRVQFCTDSGTRRPPAERSFRREDAGGDGGRYPPLGANRADGP
jgi:hypothetical protein